MLDLILAHLSFRFGIRNEGEVKAASYVWDSIQDAKIKITDAWAKGIGVLASETFWATNCSRENRSVVVAAINGPVSFKGGKSSFLENVNWTTVAFDKYR